MSHDYNYWRSFDPILLVKIAGRYAVRINVVLVSTAPRCIIFLIKFRGHIFNTHLFNTKPF